MPSATYDIFREAILNEKQVVFTYKDERRGACPIIIGHTDGEEKALIPTCGLADSLGLPKSSRVRIDGGEGEIRHATGAYTSRRL